VRKNDGVHRQRLDLAPGIPSGRRDPRLCLRIGRSLKTSLVDVEPKRGKDLMERKTKLELLLMHKIKTRCILSIDLIVDVQLVVVSLYRDRRSGPVIIRLPS
jgi:hypothetical protein